VRKIFLCDNDFSALIELFALASDLAIRRVSEPDPNIEPQPFGTKNRSRPDFSPAFQEQQ
jgi:hypothetical protein